MSFRISNIAKTIALGIPLVCGMGCYQHATTLGMQTAFIQKEGEKANPQKLVDKTPAKTSKFSEPNLLWSRGELQPTNRLIRVSATPGDRIEEVLVKVGDPVAKGDPLIRLASESIRAQELLIAKQKLEEARSQLSAKKVEADLQVELATSQRDLLQTQLQQAKEQNAIAGSLDSTLEAAKAQVQRMVQLTEDPRTRPLVGTLELEQKRIELAQNEAKQKQAKLTSAQVVDSATVAMNAANQKVEAAKRSRELIDSLVPIRSLEMQVALLEQQQIQLRVVATQPGTILSVSALPGEAVTTMPLIEMADLRSMSCVAEVQESQIRKVKIGQKATITSSALEKEMKGTVTRIHQLVGPHQMKLPNPMAKVDFRSIPVWIEIDAESVEVASQLVQLQVDVAIQANP